MRETKSHNLTFDAKESPAVNFGALIDKLSEGERGKSNSRKIVILIDEYDRPITGPLAKIEDKKELKNRKFVTEIIHYVFQTFKDREEQIEKCLFLGSSEFAKPSLFSSKCASLLGINKEEIAENQDIMKYLELITMR